MGAMNIIAKNFRKNNNNGNDFMIAAFPTRINHKYLIIIELLKT